VKPYSQLSPFIASVNQFPDAYVLHRESGLPLCTIEVHSCQRYDHSVCKTIIGVVTQLCLLRHFADIDSCIGFTFPKPNEKSAVTHVQVAWNQLHFGCKLQQLEAQGVKQALVHAVGSSREFLASVNPQDVGIHLPYLMRLTGVELQQLDNFGEHKVQVRSHSTVIVKGHEKIYKYCDTRWLGKYMLLKKVQPMPQQTLLPENDIQVHGFTFFVYPFLSHPLMREEACKCLGHLLVSVADAFDELHKKT